MARSSPRRDASISCHDSARGLVYISSGPQVLRYRVSDGVFLDPINLGVGRGRGLDLSPDGNTLAVADGVPIADAAGSSQSFGRIVLVNLDTLAQSPKTFPLVTSEVGPYSLAYDYVGNILIAPGIFVTNDPATQTKAPLRRYYANTDSVRTFGEWGTSNPPLLVAPRTVVTRDNDGGNVGFTETGSTSLDWGIANSWAGAIQRFTIGAGPGEGPPRGLDIATDSTDWFLPANNSTYIRNSTNDPVGGIGSPTASYNSSPYAVAIDSARSLAYVSPKGGSLLQILNAKSSALLANINAEQVVSQTSAGGYIPFGNGHLRVSKSGTLLMESQIDGVRLFPLINGLPVTNGSPANGLTTLEDTSVSFSLPNPFSASATVTYAVILSPHYGYISGDLPNASYVPYQNFNGADSFVYSVSDGTTTQTVTVPITVTPVDDPFLAYDQTFNTRIGVPATVYFYAQDGDDNQWWKGGNQDGYPRYSFEIVSAPMHGTLAVDTTNTYGTSYIYTPDAGFSGTETFTYRGVKPATGEKSSLGTVTVTVTVSGVAPIARDDHFVARTDPTCPYAYVSAPGILANDYSTTGQFSFYGGSVASDGGAIWIGSDGATAYYPPAGQPMPNGKTITYQYQFSDGGAASNVATVTLDIEPYLRASSLSYSGQAFTTFPVTLSGQGAAPLSYRIVTQPQSGTLSGTAPNLLYTPKRGANGSDSFTYQILESDGTASNTATVWISILPCPDVPVAVPDSYTTKQGKQLTVVAPGVLSNDAFKGGLAPYAFIKTQPAHGSASMSADGSFVYSPSDGFSGTDSFTYYASSGTQESVPATVSISVEAVNHAPYALSQNVSLDEDTSTNITLVAQDETPATLKYSLLTSPAHGTLSGTAPNLVYTPYSNYNGADGFSFKANDGEFDSNTASVIFTVNPVNDAPVATPQNLSVDEGSSLWIALSGSDVEGSPLTYSIVTQPKNGTIANIAPTNTWSNLAYTPTPGFVGTDSFTFKVNDGQLDSQPATVSITFKPVNKAPVAQNSSVTTTEDYTGTFDLVAGDPDGNPLSFSIVKAPQHGQVSPYIDSRHLASSYAYTPAPDYNGTDSFTFKANDGQLDSNVATVSVTVTPVNDPPLALVQFLTLDEDTTKSITLSATDVDSPTLSYSIVTPPTFGTLSGTAPNLVYTPKADFNGLDSFAFKANDGKLDSADNWINLTVNPVNDAPVAQNQTVKLDEDTTANFVLAASDVDSPNLSYTLTGNPTKGTISGTAPNLTYTPNLLTTGTDTLTWSVSDGALSASAVVTFNVAPVNHAPTLLAQNVFLNGDSTATFALRASDVDGAALTATKLSDPQNGTVSQNGLSFTYKPNIYWNGTDSFTAKVSDGKLDSATATITFYVAPVNHSPLAADDSFPAATLQGNPFVVPLYGARSITDNDINYDGPTTSLLPEIVTQPQNGSVIKNTAGFVYTPNSGWSGTDSFTYRDKTPGGAISNAATISIGVTHINVAPVASPQSVSLDARTSKAITLVATDVDSPNLTYSVTTAPTHGTLTGTAPALTYTPTGNYSGPDSFSFGTYDGQLYSNTATVSISVNPVNRAPIAQNGALALDQGTSKTIVLAASDPDGDAITYTIVSAPQKGALSGTAPNLSYTPATSASGSDSFTFKVNDGKLDSNTATVSIAIRAVNHAPTATGATVPIAFNKPTNITLAGTDPEGDTLTFSPVAGPTNGKLTGANANRTYTPNAGFIGTDSFTFRAFDGALYSAPATISLSVAPPIPVATAGSVYVLENANVSVPLKGTADSGANINAYEVVTSPKNGALSGSGNARTYTPTRFYAGADSFTFRVRDTRGTYSAPATISITVTPVNQAPSFVLPATSIAVAKNAPAQTKTAFATSVSPGPPNESGQTLSFNCNTSIVGLFSVNPSISSNGTLTFTPKPNVTGTANVQIILKDSGSTANGGQNQSQPQTFSIRVG